MSGWTPSPEDSGGSHGTGDTGTRGNADQGADPAQADPGPQPDFGAQTGDTPQTDFGAQAGDPAQTDFGTQPGPGTAAGYGPQSFPAGSAPPPGYGTGYGTGYASPPGYGTPGYAQPGPDGSFPPPPSRNRARTWFGIIGGIVVLALVIAGVSAYIVNKSKKWELSVPTSVAGLTRDTNPLDEADFSSGVAQFKANVTSLHGYGKLKSTVSAIYKAGSSQAIGFAGLNGTFDAQIVLKPGNGVKVSNVNPGPHGGAAECARTSTETICQWSTSTTIGRLDIIPVATNGSPESISAADTLMIKIRDAAERPAHGS